MRRERGRTVATATCGQRGSVSKALPWLCCQFVLNGYSLHAQGPDKRIFKKTDEEKREETARKENVSFS